MYLAHTLGGNNLLLEIRRIVAFSSYDWFFTR